MTTDVDVSSKGEIEDNCGLDLNSHQDLPNGDCNGKDHAQGSYVFANGNDGVAEESDLNGHCFDKEIENGVGGLNVGNREIESIDNCIREEQVGGIAAVAVEESSRDVRETLPSSIMISKGECQLPQVHDYSESTGPLEQNPDSQIKVNHAEEEVERESKSDPLTHVKEKQESQFMLTEDVPKEPAESTPEEGPSGDLEIDLEQKLKTAHIQSETEAVSAPVSDENGDGLSAGHDQDSVLEAIVVNDSGCNGSIGNVESGESLPILGVEVEENPETDSVETKSINGPVSDESGEGLRTGHTSEGISETVVTGDSVDASQNMPEEHGSIENIKSSPSLVACGESLPDAIVELSNETPVETLGVKVEDNPETALKAPAFSKGAESLVVASQNTPKENGSSKIAKSLPSDVAVVESGESCPPAPISDTVVEPDVEIWAPTITEIYPVSVIDDLKTETEDGKLDVKSSESTNSYPVDNTQVEIEVENGPVGDDTDVRSETETGFGSIESEDKVSNLPSCDVNIESEGSEGVTEHASSQHFPVDTRVESHATDSVETKSRLPTCPGADLEPESEVENLSSVSSRDMPDDGIVSEAEILTGSGVNGESATSRVSDVENGGNQLISGDNDDKTCEEVKAIDGIHCEGSTIDASEGQSMGAEVEKRPFFFMIRIPRFDDNNLKEQIKHVQLLVEEKTQSRDAIRVEIQTERVTCKEYGDNFEAAIAEERAARELLKSKRQEIDSVQSVINRVKNAMSVEDIDGRIRHMQHMIEHETLPLKEEKQFIREIKQLKQLREQLSSNLGRQEEVQQALDQKDQIEERLKSLRKEADLLRDKVLKAEAACKVVKKIYYDETDKLNILQTRFKDADYIRQEAYAQFHSLKKQLHEKNKNFWKYRNDVKNANDFVKNGNREALQDLCVEQVERVMELWNNNDEFRQEYVKCNTRSTLRRLKTLDGRALGPDEEPPVIPYVGNERSAKVNAVSLNSTLEGEKREQAVALKAEKVDDKPVAKADEQKNETAKSKKPAKPVPAGNGMKSAKPVPSANGMATASGRDEIVAAREEEHERTKEEEELIRKAEELRKEEEAAKLKEQCRLEEKAKAKEAQERKKRNADKAQAKAALRAQKEAEQKEKEREKRTRKKERRNAAASEDTNVITEGESAPSLETPTETAKESETRVKSLAMAKRPKKAAQFTKQTKAKSIPPPLRNRGKRRLQPWMWFLLTVLFVFVLFLVGNSGFSFKFGLQRFGF